MTVLDETFVPTDEETERAKNFSRILAREFAPAESVTIQRDDGEESIEIPRHVFNVLMRVLAVMSEGKAFSLIPMDKELTTQQAADILNVSRPYLNKILDLGDIAHRKVGRNRRIKFSDLMEYKKSQEQKSKAALQELAKQAQELDMGYQKLSGFTAVLDACVLYPAPLRDLLMSLAADGLYRAKWSQQIHDEWTRNLLKNRKDLTPEQMERCCTCMNAAVPDSLVTGYEDLIDSLTLKDPDDRHVLAVAIRSNADSIVTFNQKDFDETELSKFDLYSEHPDEFICNVIETYTPKVISTVREMRARLSNPAKPADEFLETLRNQGLPQSVEKLSDYSESL